MAFEYKEKVEAFKKLMEFKLEKNQHKNGWKNDSASALLERIREEMLELENEIFLVPTATAHSIALEAVDIACFCMMIADNAGALEDDVALANIEASKSELYEKDNKAA